MWTMNTKGQRDRWEKNRVKTTTTRYQRVLDKYEKEKEYRRTGKRPQPHNTQTMLLNKANNLPVTSTNWRYGGNNSDVMGQQEDSLKARTTETKQGVVTEETYVLKSEKTALGKLQSAIGKGLGTKGEKSGMLQGGMGTILMLLIIIIFLQMVIVVEKLENGTPVTRMSALFGVFGGKYAIDTTAGTSSQAAGPSGISPYADTPATNPKDNPYRVAEIHG